MDAEESKVKFLTALSTEGERAEWTIRNYSSAINRLLLKSGRLVIGDVTTDDVRDFLGQFDKATRGQYRLRLRSFFKWLHDQGIITDNPMLRIMSSGAAGKKLLGESEWLTVDESERLKKHADTPEARATLHFALDTGCRRESLVSPVKFDLGPEGCKATVREKRHREGRLVYFRQSTADLLAHVNALESWPFFNEAQLAELLRDTAKRAGIEKKVTPLTLRHTFACQCRLLGMKIEDLKDAMGHANISTTMIYANVGQTEQGKRYRELFEDKEKVPAGAQPEPEA